MDALLKQKLLDYLEEDQLAPVFEILRTHLPLVKPDRSLRFTILEKHYQHYELDFKNGRISQTEYAQNRLKTIQELKELIDDLPVDELRPSAPATAPPPKAAKKPSLLDKAVDQFKDWFPGKRSDSSKPDIPVKGPSKRIPTTIPPRKSKAKPPTSSGAEPPEEELEKMAPPPAADSGPKASTTYVPPPAPPPPAPAPTAPPPVSPFQKGKILYAIPATMALAQACRCRVRIAPTTTDEAELMEGLTEKEKAAATREGLKITSVMKVELEEVGTVGNFTIVARNNVEQPILPFGFTEWGFDVTPQRPGHYALLLRVTAKVQVPGFGERPFDVAVLDRAIQVSTTDVPAAEIAFAEQPVPDPDWDDADDAAVLLALSQARLDLAIERITNFVQDKDREFQNTLVLLQGRWQDNTNQLQAGRIAAADWDIVNNKVRYAITDLVKQLRIAFPSQGTPGAMDWQSAHEKVTGLLA